MGNTKSYLEIVNDTPSPCTAILLWIGCDALQSTQSFYDIMLDPKSSLCDTANDWIKSSHQVPSKSRCRIEQQIPEEGLYIELTFCNIDTINIQIDQNGVLVREDGSIGLYTVVSERKYGDTIQVRLKENKVTSGKREQHMNGATNGAANGAANAAANAAICDVATPEPPVVEKEVREEDARAKSATEVGKKTMVSNDDEKKLKASKEEDKKAKASKDEDKKSEGGERRRQED